MGSKGISGKGSLIRPASLGDIDVIIEAADSSFSISATQLELTA